MSPADPVEHLDLGLAIRVVDRETRVAQRIAAIRVGPRGDDPVDELRLRVVAEVPVAHLVAR